MKEQTANKDWVEVQKNNMILHLRGERKVISTSCLNGGIQLAMKAVFNHCDKEENDTCRMYGDTYREHLIHAATEAGLEPCTATGLSTAVDMKYVVSKEIQWKEYTVTVWATGGILKNGRRVCDETTMEERDERFTVYEETVLPESGTINLMIHIDANLSDNALVGAVVVASEAKVAAIEEVGLKSCYSEGRATGSGTDGMVVISDVTSSVYLTQARTDVKLGECIGKAVKAAVKECLLWNLAIEEMTDKEM